jgi:PKD repeat protein
MSTLTVQNIQGSSSSSNTISVASGHVLQAPGHVIQVVQATSQSAFTSTSTSYVDTGRSVEITPKFSTSKVLVTVSATMSASAINVQPVFTIYRDSTNLEVTSNRGFGQTFNGAGSSHMMLGCSFLDSPSTTSQVSYKIYVRTNSGTLIWGADSGTQCYTAMEIAQ